MLSSLSFVLLTYNEEKTVEKAVSSAVAVAKKVSKKYELIIVQYKGSTDNTDKIIRKLATKNKNMRIIYQPIDQKGYGVALRMGLEAAKMDYIFYTDADDQFDILEMPKLVPLINVFDIVSGYRMKRMDPFGRILTAKVYRILLRILFGLKMRDIDSAFKLYRQNIFKKFKIKSAGGFVDGEILIKAKNHGFKIKEIPVHHYSRLLGKSNYGTGLIKPGVVIDVLKEIKMLWSELRKKE
jgi:glycosyltransferase involved in cell wall biosynthesis